MLIINIGEFIMNVKHESRSGTIVTVAIIEGNIYAEWWN